MLGARASRLQNVSKTAAELRDLPRSFAEGDLVLTCRAFERIDELACVVALLACSPISNSSPVHPATILRRYTKFLQLVPQFADCGSHRVPDLSWFIPGPNRQVGMSSGVGWDSLSGTSRSFPSKHSGALTDSTLELYRMIRSTSRADTFPQRVGWRARNKYSSLSSALWGFPASAAEALRASSLHLGGLESEARDR